jgi:hypothetical protein
MKLIDIKPIIFETSADDIYADQKLPAPGPELMKILETRLRGLNHLRNVIDMEKGDMVRAALITQHAVWYSSSYPNGGIRQARIDRDAGKVFIFHIDDRPTRRTGYWETFVALNTPENQRLIQRVDEARHRMGELKQTLIKLQQKIARTRRTMEAMKK